VFLAAGFSESCARGTGGLPRIVDISNRAATPPEVPGSLVRILEIYAININIPGGKRHAILHLLQSKNLHLGQHIPLSYFLRPPARLWSFRTQYSQNDH
jgi:hypothetical protein